jgi:hypothetical protein
MDEASIIRDAWKKNVLVLVSVGSVIFFSSSFLCFRR